jgi:two-component system, cell cycle sensor histidine kinase and response regulator CckA
MGLSGAVRSCSSLMSNQIGMLRPNESGDSHTAHGADKPGPQKAHPDAPTLPASNPGDAGFELLFSSHPHPMYVCDVESLRILEVNRAAVQAYGYSREEFLNMRITDIRPAEDVPRLLESVKMIGLGRVSSRGYWRHRRKNGEVFQVDVTTQRIRFGGREASLAVALDITERLAAEDKLAQHAAYVQALSENNPLAIVTLDLGRRVQMCNPAFEQLFGYNAGELLGKELDSLIAPSGRRAEMLDLVGRAFKGEVVRVATKRCRRDGSEVDVRIIGVPLVVNGKMIGTFGMYEDISDQVRAEEAQHRAEKKYERIFENAIEGFFESTPEGGFVTVNPALARIAGYSSAAEMIHEVTDIRKLYVNPEERKDVMQQLDQRGILENYECRMLRKDGSKIWVSLNARALRDVDGKVISHDGTAEDITGRKRAQLERNATTEIIRAVSATDNLDELLQLIHAALTTVLDADNCFVALLDPLTGLFHFPLFVDKFDPPPPPQKLDQSCTAYVFRSGRAMSIPQGAFDELAKSGEVELVGTPSASWLGAPLNTPSSTIGVVVVQNYHRENAYDERDLIFLSSVAGQIALAIERKRAEERVRQSEARLRVLVEQLPAVLWTVDSDLRFTSALGLGLAQLGLKPNQLVGLSLSDYFAGAEPTFAPIAAHRRAIAGERVQFSLEWKDNSYACHVEPLRDSEGRVNGAICMSLDVTDRKKLEEQFRQAQKMEAVGRLAGGIAHDFNNLLMVIQGYADLLAERIPAGDSLRRNAEQIQVAAQRAASLTQQLLAFSRKQMLAPKVLNVDSVVADMEKMLRRLIGEDIELRTSATKDLWLVKADRGQIEQVIMNLAVNARDAMPHGGRLTIETANVEFEAAVSHPATAIPAGKYVMLAVTDNGVGMDEKTQTHIFEPFFTTKEKGKGTGLGLATVYGVVKQSGGYIWVYSEPGHGTTFKIYLPQIADEISVGGRDRVSGTKDLPKGTEVVLLVEDEAGVRDLAREYLEMSNYTVIVAADGHTALELASMHAGPIDLLMTDVVMPGIGGRELAERIRRLRPGIKVLFMSGYTEHAVNQQGALGEDVVLLQKPFTLPVLASKLREILAPQPVTV